MSLRSAPSVWGAPPAIPAPGAGPLYIQEYRVSGAEKISQREVEEAVYPFLGPGRAEQDVKEACRALEEAYRANGYQTVSVAPEAPEVWPTGVVPLRVVEGKVGRLRVKGSRYYSLENIKRQVPSMQTGVLPNFNAITRDIVALNQLADRRVTPSLRAGVEPGTVDIDLAVADKFPLHGSIELNNRYSADTTALRVNGSISYQNLWQLGHALGLSFQVAPERTDDAKVYSAYYLARFPQAPGLTLTLLGTKQDSNVSTLGGAAVTGRGEVLGLRVGVTLPALTNFFHSLSLGFDYKHFDENVVFGTGLTQTPISYYPITAGYFASWGGRKDEATGHREPLTELNAGITFHLRGLGSSPTSFDQKRFRADGSFIYFRGELSHTRELAWGWEGFASVQAQASDQPLINSEQLSGGGLGTVRGYLESTVLGDSGVFGSLELRSPSLSIWLGKRVNEWRFYVFGEGGLVTLNEPLPEQQHDFDLASIGIGSRVQFLEHFNGSIDAGVPLVSQAQVEAGDPLVTFRVWAEF